MLWLHSQHCPVSGTGWIKDTHARFGKINAKMREIIYSIKPPQHMLFDLDSTLLNTYGSQKGEGFSFHYQAHGYHPLLCFDGLTGDLLKVELRDLFRP